MSRSDPQHLGELGNSQHEKSKDTMTPRDQSQTYYAARDYLRSLDPNIGNRALAQLVRALIETGAIRACTLLVDRDGNPIEDAR